MEGTETGWGRPAEPAPRWRALLDRALLGSRSGEQPEVVVDQQGMMRRASGGPPPRPRGTNGRAPYEADNYDDGYPPDARYDRGYPNGGYPNGARPNGGYPDDGYGSDGYPSDGYPSDGYPRDGYPVEYPEPPPRRSEAYAPGGGYADDPSDYPPSRYAALEEQRYRPPASPPLPPPPPPPANGYGAATTAAPAGYPPASGRLEWRQSRPDPEVERAVSVLRRDLGNPKVLAFANPKGGVHKTTATVLAAATVGSVRGRGVLAWDDNELRGTLGLRAGSARHARTIRHLIADLAEVEAQHGLGLKDALDDYLRHASDGSYDVLAGEESPRFAQRLDQYTVRRVLELMRRTHDVICVDTGNNVESANWQTVLQAADQLVITTVPREDAAFTADWMIDLLHEVGMSELADNAVTLLSCPTPGKSPLLDDLAGHFEGRTRAVAVVPYDPALEAGSSIEYAQLQPETREAWLKAASVMLEPFVR